MASHASRSGRAVLAFAFLLLCAPCLRADDALDAAIEAHTQAALKLLADADGYAAVEYCLAIPRRDVAVDVLGDLLFKAYYDRKDMAQTILIGQSGIALALDLARQHDAADPKRAAAIRNCCRAMAYNLGSFCWPGWAEKGIVLSPNDLRAGREAAALSLRLVEGLKLGDLPRSRGNWLIGAHDLAAGRHDQAVRRFNDAAALAGKDPEGATDQQLCLGYAALAKMAADANDAAARTAFEAAKAKLRTMQEGPFFVQQLDTAAGVFCPARPAAE